MVFQAQTVIITGIDEAGCSERSLGEILSASPTPRPNLLDLSSHSGDNSTAAEERCSELGDVLRDLEIRLHVVEEMLKSLSLAQSSPVLTACMASLKTRMPLILGQARLLIQSIKESRDGSMMYKGSLHSSFAIVRASRYLDTIEAAMGMSERRVLDTNLQSLLDDANLKPLEAILANDFCFHVSPRIVSTLAFDIPAGLAVRHSLIEKKGNPPIHIEVEPVYEVQASEVLAGRGHLPFRPVKLEIEKCKHDDKSFMAGTIGECVIQIRVAPLDVEGDALRVWGVEPEVEHLYVKEARA